MSDLFTAVWMKRLQEKWNQAEELVGPLAEAGFSARIAYGYKGEEQPRGMLVIENGVVSHAGVYDGGVLDWDLRASAEDWRGWIEDGFGLTKLGPAVATGALQFVTGNYRQMIRNPSLANPFLHHFDLMQGLGG